MTTDEPTLTAATRQRLGQIKGGHAAQQKHPGLAARAGRAGQAALREQLSDPSAWMRSIALRRWARHHALKAVKAKGRKRKPAEPRKPAIEWI